MKQIRWNISAGAIVLFALLFFFDGSGVVSAVLPAAAVHELGHILALRLCRCRLIAVSIGLTGARLDYAPRLYGPHAALCAFAGPFAGVIYAVAACTLGGVFWRMSGAASFLLSAFNLLPILPLDGGKIAAQLLPSGQMRCVSLIAALLLCIGGVVLFVRYASFALLCMGVWLVICNLWATRAAEEM